MSIETLSKRFSAAAGMLRDAQNRARVTEAQILLAESEKRDASLLKKQALERWGECREYRTEAEAAFKELCAAINVAPEDMKLAL